MGREKKRVVDENDKNEESMKYEGDVYLPMVVNVLHAPNDGESGEFIVRHSLPENNPLTSSLLAYARSSISYGTRLLQSRNRSSNVKLVQ